MVFDVMFLRSCSLAVRAPVQTLLRSTVRSISTSRTTGKDPDEEEKLDLDVWKTVMKTQALPESQSDPSPSALDVNRELVEMWHQAGKLVPQNITDEQLQDLAALTTKSAKKKFLKFLAIKEAHKISKKEKRENKPKPERNIDGEERELRNTFLMKFWSGSMDRLQNWRAAQAMRFGQPLVYDMSYERHMTRREMENAVSQLMETEGFNRRSPDPFHLHFCGLTPGGAYHSELLKRYGAETWERMLITDTASQPVDMFRREDLVYLTADSHTVLRQFDHRKVYVVGAIVDRSIQSGISLANAKRLQLATARLPLDEHLDWDSGAKNLTLDQMMRILSTVKDTGDWKTALEFVPKRKHCGFHQMRTGKTQYVRNESAAPKNKTDGHKRERKTWWEEEG